MTSTGCARCQPGRASKRGEMQMKRISLSCLLISFGVAALAGPAAAGSLPQFAYTSNLSCLNSTSGFSSSFVPNTAGTAWSTNITGIGSGSGTATTSTATELDTYIVTAVYGDKPTTDGPSGEALQPTSSRTSPGRIPTAASISCRRSISGTFTAGPNKGLTYTATTSGQGLKTWFTNSGTVAGGPTTPAVQTITLSNKTSYERVCTITLTTLAPVNSGP